MSGIEPSPPDVTNPAWLDSVLLSLPPATHYCFALSGGLDSVSLLSLLAPILRARGALLRAIHVHHGLSPNADTWADFCQSLCKQHHLSCQIHKVQVEPDGSGLEAAARKARYDVFRRELMPDEVLLQGHHQDDQAETVLLRLMRGATPDQLAAIPQRRVLGQGCLFRPWLGVPRQFLLATAQQHGLRWIEDESNQDLALDRNYLRLAVLPALTQRWPSARVALARVAAQAGQQHELLAHLLEPSFAAAIEMTPFGLALRLEALRPLSSLHRDAVIRRWLDCLSIPQIPSATLHRFEREVLGVKADSSPELRWGMHSVRAYRDRLFYVPVAEDQIPALEHSVDVSALPLRVEMGGWRVQLSEAASMDVEADLRQGCAVIAVMSSGGNFCLRHKRQKDALRLPSGQHQQLKTVFQDMGVPPWWRPAWPMLFSEDVLVCAGPGKVDPLFRHDSGTGNTMRRLVVRWSRNPMPSASVKF